MGETDKKEFYRRELNSDKTALGSAITALLRLENRWPETSKEIKETVIFLRAIRDVLTEEGHAAYKPKIIEEVVEEIIEEIAEEVKPTAEELAKELEVKRLMKAAKAKEDKIAKLKADLEQLEIGSD